MKRKTCALMALFGLSAASTVAGDIYKCVGSDGSLSYQARPCGQGQAESTVTIRNAPPPPPVVAPAQPEPPAVSREQGLDFMSRPRSSASPAAPPNDPPAKSYKCTAGNGFVFYRHDDCPSTIDIGKASTSDGYGRPIRYVTNVVGEEITRAEACAQIYKVTASSRDGSHLDQRVSSYDKNLGRDHDCNGY